MKGIAATVLASILNTIVTLSLLGMVSTINGPIGPAQFAIMAGAGAVLALVVFLVWFAGMALRWALGGEVGDD